MNSIAVVGVLFSTTGLVFAQQKPNILVIFGDDIGQSNISVYSRGLMGFTTPTSTASATKAAYLSNIMDSRVAPQDARRSLRGRVPFVPD